MASEKPVFVWFSASRLGIAPPLRPSLPRPAMRPGRGRAIFRLSRPPWPRRALRRDCVAPPRQSGAGQGKAGGSDQA